MVDGLEMSRVETRAEFDSETRLRLIESDLDSIDGRFESLQQDISDIRKAQSRILWTLMGAVFTFTTSSILLAINALLPR